MWNILHCFAGSLALAQIRYKNLARAIFSSLWNGVPGVRNPNRSLLTSREGHWKPAMGMVLHLFQCMFLYKDRGTGLVLFIAQLV